MTDFYIKQNDTKPTLSAVLVETPSGGEASAIDLTLATKVSLVVRERGATDPAPPKFKKECAILVPAEGKIEYIWETGDTNTSGEFYFEFEIEWEDGALESVPRKGYYLLDVEDDLG